METIIRMPTGVTNGPEECFASSFLRLTSSSSAPLREVRVVDPPLPSANEETGQRSGCQDDRVDGKPDKNDSGSSNSSGGGEDDNLPAPKFKVIEPWHVVLGDTHARADRTTEATVLLRQIKADFKERYKNRKRTWIPDALKAFDAALEGRFPASRYPHVNPEDRGRVLFKCTEKAKDRRILEPNAFGYPKDVTATYGLADRHDAIVHFFKSRDSPTLEHELARYRREFDALAANPVEQPPEQLMVDFGETLVFFERKLGRAAASSDEGPNLASKLLEDLKPINALKEQWRALVAVKHPVGDATTRQVSLVTNEEKEEETAEDPESSSPVAPDAAVPQDPSLQEFHDGDSSLANLRIRSQAKATGGELHPLMENMSELGDGMSLGEPPSVDMMQMFEFFCSTESTAASVSGTQSLDRALLELEEEKVVAATAAATDEPEKDNVGTVVEYAGRNVRRKRCHPDKVDPRETDSGTGHHSMLEVREAANQVLVGMQNSLRVPDHWDVIRDPNIAQLHHLDVGDREYASVSRAFLSTLPKSARIVRISRVQNLHMWQSYVVKRQNICHREMYVAGGTMSVAVAEKMWKLAMSRFERRWLWHGTSAVDTGKILQQGFNRSFAGKNATSYGMGVYFARDAKYSAYKSYAMPDQRGHQFVMACRVMVGEYCQAKKDDKAPAVRNVATNQLFDSTVNDTGNPSIHVIYHDAQAYPEYLIEFTK